MIHNGWKTAVYDFALSGKKDKLLMLYRIGSRVVEESYIDTAGGHFEKAKLHRKAV